MRYFHGYDEEKQEMSHIFRAKERKQMEKKCMTFLRLRKGNVSNKLYSQGLESKTQEITEIFKGKEENYIRQAVFKGEE